MHGYLSGGQSRTPGSGWRRLQKNINQVLLLLSQSEMHSIPPVVKRAVSKSAGHAGGSSATYLDGKFASHNFLIAVRTKVFCKNWSALSPIALPSDS